MIRRAVSVGVLLLGVGRALAQTSIDTTLATVETGAAEKSVAGAARAVTQSAIGTVFGGTQPAVPPASGAPEAAVPAALPPTGVRPVAVPPNGSAEAMPNGADGVRFDGSGSGPGNAGSEEAAAAAAQAMAVALAQRGRDPFRPFTLDLRPENTESEPLTPLQRYELAQLRLAGVVLNLRPPRAMLQDNSGMGYIVTPGTPIGRRHGVVKSIEPKRLVVEEHILDYYGREQVHQVVIEMPKDTRQASAGQE